MGFFDKAKQFLGGKKMANVEITVIERQPAKESTFRITDSVLKGTMVVTAQQACTLLGLKYEVWLHVKNEQGGESPMLVVSEKYPDPNTSYTGDFVQMPAELEPGQVITHPWLVIHVDVPRVLASAGIAEPASAVDNPRVRLSVKCIADVKGSPFDPSDEVDVQLIA